MAPRLTLARLRERVASFSEPGEEAGAIPKCAKMRRSRWRVVCAATPDYPEPLDVG